MTAPSHAVAHSDTQRVYLLGNGGTVVLPRGVSIPPGYRITGVIVDTPGLGEYIVDLDERAAKRPRLEVEDAAGSSATSAPRPTGTATR